MMRVISTYTLRISGKFSKLALVIRQDFSCNRCVEINLRHICKMGRLGKNKTLQI